MLNSSARIHIQSRKHKVLCQVGKVSIILWQRLWMMGCVCFLEYIFFVAYIVKLQMCVFGKFKTLVLYVLSVKYLICYDARKQA